VLENILNNVELARRKSAPLCQDTGALIFVFRVPVGLDSNALVAKTRGAVSKATQLGYLRQNTYDSVTGASYETNIAHGSPVLTFRPRAGRLIDVHLLMKGGGSENQSRQYSLPDAEFDAGRDLEGARRCILDAVQRAQGDGCAPGTVGVCIGGDRTTGHEHAKEQFFRKLDDKSPVRALARLERRVMRDANKLGIGPMGIGGETTLLGAKIGALSHVPASFFVTVSYMCWAYRRRGVVLGQEGDIKRWLSR
jgi:fumarate hydratase class I